MLAPAWCRSPEPREVRLALISPLLASLPDYAAREEVLHRPPREAWTLARVLDALLLKMGCIACWLSHAMGRRKASLGTPVPRTPTEGLECLLVKMGRTARRLSHAVGRRQASLGTPVPRTPTMSGSSRQGRWVAYFVTE